MCNLQKKQQKTLFDLKTRQISLSSVHSNWVQNELSKTQADIYNKSQIINDVQPLQNSVLFLDLYYKGLSLQDLTETSLWLQPIMTEFAVTFQKT